MKLSESENYMTYMRAKARGDFTEAERALQLCIGEVGGPPYQKAFLLTRMGNLALSQGRAEESIRYYEQAVEADAVSLQPVLFFAEFLAHQVGNYVAAIEKCDYIIERAAAHPFDEDDEEMSSADYEAKALEIHAYCVSRLPAS